MDRARHIAARHREQRRREAVEGRVGIEESEDIKVPESFKNLSLSEKLTFLGDRLDSLDKSKTRPQTHPEAESDSRWENIQVYREVEVAPKHGPFSPSTLHFEVERDDSDNTLEIRAIWRAELTDEERARLREEGLVGLIEDYEYQELVHQSYVKSHEEDDRVHPNLDRELDDLYLSVETYANLLFSEE